MGFLKRRLLGRAGRFSPLGRLLDLAVVAGAGVRFANRKGWVSQDQLRSWGLGSMVGAPGGSGHSSAVGSSSGLGELAVLGGALLRLWRGRRKRRLR